jgi:hypothetical protein
LVGETLFASRMAALRKLNLLSIFYLKAADWTLKNFLYLHFFDIIYGEITRIIRDASSFKISEFRRDGDRVRRRSFAAWSWIRLKAFR